MGFARLRLAARAATRRLLALGDPALARQLGELAMDVMGEEAEVAEGFPYKLKRLQRVFLFARAETIYGGSNQIQRNQIAERALGLPREQAPQSGARSEPKASEATAGARP